MHLILNYMKPNRGKVVLGLFIKFIATITELMIPRILAHIINELVPQKNINIVLLWGSIMIICALIASGCNIVANRIASKVAMLTAKSLRYDTFNKVLYLSSEQVDRLSIPSIVSRLSSDTYEIHNYVGLLQRMGVRAPIMLFGGLIMTMTLDVKLSFVLMALVPVLSVLIILITKKGIPLFNETRIVADRLVQSVRENVTGIRVIKALSKSKYENEKFDDINNLVRNKNVQAEKVMALSHPSIELFLNLGMVLVILIGAFSVNNGTSEVGTIIAFTSYFTIILNSAVAVSKIFVKSSRAIASAARLEEILDMPESLKVEEKEDYVDNNCVIEFKNVSFSYNKKIPDIENISFKIKKGETLGIIGGTGSGKTTIISLLLRLYDCDSGEIRINGKNINTIPMAELHSIFGVVFQDDVIFNNTIRENIDFGRNMDSEQIENAGEYAQASEFINNFQQKYDYLLAIRGNNVSGGQKQRILISRAIAGNPEILLLDDSSSALDYKTDADLRKNLKDNLNNTTSIIIAQRISSIMNAEHILVLDRGKEIGYGRHEELLQNCETYKNISDTQIGSAEEKSGETDE